MRRSCFWLLTAACPGRSGGGGSGFFRFDLSGSGDGPTTGDGPIAADLATTDGTSSADAAADLATIATDLTSADLAGGAADLAVDAIMVLPADLAVAPSCNNAKRDGDESDVDCGGSCPPCTAGKACNKGGDCQSGSCTNPRCDAPGCMDGITNGDESDLDCGGAMCPKCGLGKACEPYYVVAADLVGDAAIDLAIANSDSSNVSVLRGNGNGTFAAANSYTVGTGPYQVLAGDFNGDARVDLLSINVTADTMTFLRNLGNGSFAVATSITVPNGPWNAVALDLNGNGALDVAIAK